MSKGHATEKGFKDAVSGVLCDRVWLFAGAAFILGALFSLGVHSLTEHLSAPAKPLRLSMIGDSHYRFIDPLISSSVDSVEVPHHFESLDRRLRSEISRLIEDGHIRSASVYVRDFNSGTGLEVYSGERYNPASLLKVPIMMAFFKIAEGRPSILRERVTVGKLGATANQHAYAPQQKLKPWNSYSIGELIEHMIMYSDNDAATALVDFLNDSGRDYEVLNEVFNDLGVRELRIGSNFIDPKTYSLFFRVLYNATYLNREMSEKALGLLSRTDFNGGIRAGIPTTTPISHKFGEFTAQSETGIVIEHQLHDCGIVYAQKQPFTLCVMTKGMKFDQLSSAILQLTKIVYEDAVK